MLELEELLLLELEDELEVEPEDELDVELEELLLELEDELEVLLELGSGFESFGGVFEPPPLEQAAMLKLKHSRRQRIRYLEGSSNLLL